MILHFRSYLIILRNVSKFYLGNNLLDHNGNDEYYDDHRFDENDVEMVTVGRDDE